MTNKWSKKRQLLMRPVVCAPGPPPPPLPTSVECTITPEPVVSEEFEEIELTIVATNPDADDNTPVDILLSTADWTLQEDTIPGGGAPEIVGIFPEVDPPSSINAEMKITWHDAQECIVPMTLVHNEAENGE